MIFFVYDDKIQEWAPFDLLKRSMQASIKIIGSDLSINASIKFGAVTV